MTMHTTHHPTHTNSMSAISQQLQNWFSRNFKHMFFGTSSRDTNYHIDVCPINISNGNISPYNVIISFSKHSLCHRTKFFLFFFPNLVANIYDNPHPDIFIHEWGWAMVLNGNRSGIKEYRVSSMRIIMSILIYFSSAGHVLLKKF